MGTPIQMYIASAGGTEVASIDVPENGHLVGVDVNMYADIDVDAETVAAQLSFSSALVNANDSRSVICNAEIYSSQVTAAGVSMNNVSKFVGPIEVPVSAGERLYLHVVSSTTIAGRIRFVLFFDFDSDRPAVRRR